MSIAEMQHRPILHHAFGFHRARSAVWHRRRQEYQRPSIRIDADRFLERNVTRISAVVVRMSSFCHRDRFFRSVGDEQFLAGNAQTFAAMDPVELGTARREPVPVSLEPFVLSSSSRQLHRIGDVFDDKRLRSSSADACSWQSLLPASSYLTGRAVSHSRMADEFGPANDGFRVIMQFATVGGT